MLGVGVSVHAAVGGFLAHTGGVAQTPETIFDNVFLVFLLLGTLVGVVVIAYTVYNAVKYRDGDGRSDDDAVDRPQQGELPTGAGGGRKLFLSFGLSALIVLSLIVWTYGLLMFVEDEPEGTEIDVIGQRFSWEFVYPNGESTRTLRVPRGEPIQLQVTSSDVFHNIGIPAVGVKADAIPGQTTSVWFVADELGTFSAICYELCGAGHSGMRSDVVVMEPEAYADWYENTTGS
jgi:cytochrome c oxidase subunit 2